MTSTSETSKNLASLRQLLKKEDLDGYIIPRNDEFLGEYVPPAAERLRWLTGFTGSWGTAIVTRKKAALIVDGRYTIQALRETRGLSIELLPPDNAKLISFLSAIGASAKIGFDPWLTSITEARRLTELAGKSAISLVATKDNLIDRVWLNRPPLVTSMLVSHPLALAGVSNSDKLASIAKILKDNSFDSVVLSDPHSVAWLLNIRGSDVSHTPIALLRAIVRKDSTCTLFVAKSRVPEKVLNSLDNAVEVKSPQVFEEEIKKLAARKSKVMLDPALCPEAIRLILAKSNAVVVEHQDPCSLPRACKNTVEQKGARKAHVRDGAALANFLSWLDKEAPRGTVTERSAQEKLKNCRMETGKLQDLSFGSISAAGPNAAMPHYHVSTKHGRKLVLNQVYLIDSGGQYRDGTTDVTRTVIIGKPSGQMKRHFTLVLKGMIAVSAARFPSGTNGAQIDTLARAALWRHGLDFDHGTGHGVGSYLSVHEGPARISKLGLVPLQPGMILSNEPGFYLKGKYGIRIENLLLVREPSTPEGGNRPMLSFETLTYAPIDKRLIDENMLTRDELNWLNNYHIEVLQKIGGFVNVETQEWLRSACKPFKQKT